MNRTKVALFVVFCVVIGGFAYWYIEQSQKSNKVVIAQAFQHLLYIGLYVAKDGGFFEEQGLDVTITTAGGDDKAFVALSSGEADFAQGDPAFVAIANEKGWDGRVVTMAVDRVAFWAVTFDKAIEPFTDPAGFKGLKVATYPKPNTSYVVQEQLSKRADLQLGTDTEIVQVQFGSEIAALKNGQVDIAHTIEPIVTQVEQQGGSVVYSYPDAYGPLAFTGVMVSQKTIEERGDMVQRVVTAYEKAFQFIASNPAGTLEIAKKQLPDLDESIIKRALERLTSSGSIPPHAAVDPESWRKLLNIRVEVGDLKGMPEKNLIDNSFAKKSVE